MRKVRSFRGCGDDRKGERDGSDFHLRILLEFGWGDKGMGSEEVIVLKEQLVFMGVGCYGSKFYVGG